MAQTSIQPVLTNSEARKLTDRINATSTQLYTLLLEAHDGQAWKALGYASWRAYVDAEFDISRQRAYQLLDQGRVIAAVTEAANVSTDVDISEASARAIKPVVKQVAAEIKAKVEGGADPIKTTYAVIEAAKVEAKAAKIPPPMAPVIASPVPPKKGEPTVESLLAENEALRDELREARDNARSLAEMLESYDSVTAGEAAAAKEMARLRAQLRTVEATRDQWMTTAGELRKEVKSLQRKLGGRK